MDNILFEIKHIDESESIKDFVIHVEPAAHGQIFNSKKSVMILFNILKPLFKYTPTKFIPLVSSDNQDSPFYFDKNKKMIIDNKNLIDSKCFFEK